jgi:hypothetical protein
MENYHSAYLGGEYARLRPKSVLEDLQRKYSGDPSTLGLHTVIPENMATHADEKVKIIAVSFYHFGFALYELAGLSGEWPEAALIDQEFCIDDDEPGRKPANLTYRVVKSDDCGFVSICDLTGRVYCTLRKHDTDAATNDINRAAKLRSRSSFASRYNFDGKEYEELQPFWDEFADIEENFVPQLHSVGDMLSLLGEPSEHIPSQADNRKFVNQFWYRDRWNALDLCIQELPDGTLDFIYQPKR